MNTLIIYFTFIIFVTRTISEKITCKEIRAFVDGHNSRRLQVAKGQIKNQPSSSEMKFMMWDNELYLKAASWAAQYPQNHNPDRSVPSGRFSVGENIHWYSITNRNYKINPDQALGAWFNEHKNYTYGPLQMSDFDGSKDYQIGHYTQMVWSDSIYVGCAIAERFKRPWKKFTVICNYGPSGNFLGREPYKRGRAANALQCACGANDINCDCNKPYGSGC